MNPGEYEHMWCRKQPLPAQPVPASVSFNSRWRPRIVKERLLNEGARPSIESGSRHPEISRNLCGRFATVD